MGEVVAQDELILRRAEWKRNGRRVVFVSGAFDLLHPGHVRLLEQARALGDILVAGVQSDAAVRAAVQNPARPVNPAAERAEILAGLASVDWVVEFDAASPAPLVAQLAPDVIVEGADPRQTAESSPNRDAGDTTPSPAGAKLVRIPLEPGYSAGRLLDRIKELGRSKQASPLEPPRQSNA